MPIARARSRCGSRERTLKPRTRSRFVAGRERHWRRLARVCDPTGVRKAAKVALRRSVEQFTFVYTLGGTHLSRNGPFSRQRARSRGGFRERGAPGRGCTSFRNSERLLAAGFRNVAGPAWARRA